MQIKNGYLCGFLGTNEFKKKRHYPMSWKREHCWPAGAAKAIGKCLTEKMVMKVTQFKKQRIIDTLP